MTIKLLAPWGDAPVNAVVLLDAATEASLIANKQALASAGPVTWPVVAASQYSELNPIEVAAARALVSEAGKQAAQRNLDGAAVRSAVYPMTDGSGAALREQSGRGPSITVGGAVANAWANAGWFTHDSAGNTIKLAGNAMIEGLLDMQSECSILIGADVYLAAWPSATETLWSIHRPDTTAGGFRIPMPSGSPGRFGVYYRPNGGGSNTEQVGYTIPSGYLNRRISTLTEIRISGGALHLYLFIDGRIQRGGTFTLGTPPVSDAGGGLSFSGEGVSSLNKLGSNGSGARSALCYVLRTSGKDRNLAGRLAAHVWATGSLPSWINRI